MDNQHKQIKGYRDLTQADIDLMNCIKAHAELTRALVDDVSASLSKYEAGIERGPFTWIRLSEDHLQQGFMALTRAVAQPTTY